MRKTPYWLGLLCLAVLVLMPDITVNAQLVPSEQGPNGQMSNEKDQGTDTQSSKGEQTPMVFATASSACGCRPAGV